MKSQAGNLSHRGKVSKETEIALQGDRVLHHFWSKPVDLGEGSKKKHKKKLTNVSLYVCMSAENSKMLVFVCFFMFFPIVA